VDVLGFDTKFLHLSRREQCSNVGNNGALSTTEHDPVALVQNTVRKHNVNGRSKTFDHLDFEHSTFDLRQVHELLGHTLLSEGDQKLEHVWNTFTCMCRCRHKRNVFGH